MDSQWYTGCYEGSDISPEKIIPEHFFLYVTSGTMAAYDGGKEYLINEGEAVLARKNHLIRYNKGDAFKGIALALDETFLKGFQKRYFRQGTATDTSDSFLPIVKSELLNHYITGLNAYYSRAGNLDSNFADVKREELLLILLGAQPALSGILFNFSSPQRAALSEFMNRNFRFNISLKRFAYLTGRSLSSFKRDFYEAFGQTPGNWLTAKRLDEAYYLMDKQQKIPSEIYLELGFENLSHFSTAFRKRFGFPPRLLKG